MKDKTRRISLRALAMFRVLFTLCAIFTVIFIFLNSAKNGALSGGRSAQATEFLNNLAGKIGISYRFSEYMVRKLAHFSEYALLGFWLMLALRVYTRRILSFVTWPLFLGLFTAVADETFQLLVPGRSGELKDVVIDFSGVVSGIVAGLFAILLAAAVWDTLHGRR